MTTVLPHSISGNLFWHLGCARPSLSAFCSLATLTPQTAAHQHLRQSKVLLKGQLAQGLSWRPGVHNFTLNYCMILGGRDLWGSLVQPAQSRVNFKLTVGCSGPYHVAFWVSSRMEVLQVPVAVFDHCHGAVKTSLCKIYSHHLTPGNGTCLDIFLHCKQPRQISIRL